MLNDAKPALLFYCQHSLGMGHLIRSFSLARALSERFRVIFLNGGPLPSGLSIPPGVEVIDLPPLGMDADGQLRSRDPRHSVEQAKQARRQFLLASLERWAPQALLIELFPFGRKKFAFELLPLLRAARQTRSAPRPLVLCSVRDLLVTSRRDQQRHDDRARWLTDRYFDAVLVHADPRFVRFEASFRPRRPLRAPLHYTGFVLPKPVTLSRRRRRQVLVSAGSGSVGTVLFTAAVDAYDYLWSTERLPMHFVAGPFLPAADWRDLQQRACSRPGLTLQRSVPDLRSSLAAAAASVSQCGYNTAMDLLQAATPALVVPFADGREDEQTNRARRLERLGLLRVLPPTQLDGARLGAEIRALLDFRPQPVGLNLAGAANSARLIAKLCGQASRAEAFR